MYILAQLGYARIGRLYIAATVLIMYAPVELESDGENVQGMMCPSNPKLTLVDDTFRWNLNFNAQANVTQRLIEKTAKISDRISSDMKRHLPLADYWSYVAEPFCLKSDVVYLKDEIVKDALEWE